MRNGPGSDRRLAAVEAGMAGVPLGRCYPGRKFIRVQGTDACRREADRRCCAAGACCHQQLSPRTLKDARDTLRAALGYAMTEDELINRNPAVMVKLPALRSRKVRAWSVAEACAFLDAARTSHDRLYAAYVLMLVLGLRRPKPPACCGLTCTWTPT